MDKLDQLLDFYREAIHRRWNNEWPAERIGEAHKAIKDHFQAARAEELPPRLKPEHARIFLNDTDLTWHGSVPQEAVDTLMAIAASDMNSRP